MESGLKAVKPSPSTPARVTDMLETLLGIPMDWAWDGLTRNILLAMILWELVRTRQALNESRFGWLRDELRTVRQELRQLQASNVTPLRSDEPIEVYEPMHESESEASLTEEDDEPSSVYSAEDKARDRMKIMIVLGAILIFGFVLLAGASG